MFCCACWLTGAAQNTDDNTAEMNFHSFTMTDINGIEIDLSTFKGKKLLVVNVASECGFTSQYEQLQELYEQYGGDGFEIIAFPANNFGGQEPGTSTEIKEFCTSNYGVSFTVMEKISVTGDDQHELYQWLLDEANKGAEEVEMIWNFQKFFIDEDGNYTGWEHPKTLPTDEAITNWISS